MPSRLRRAIRKPAPSSTRSHLCLFQLFLNLIFHLLFVCVCSYLALTSSVFMAFIWSRLLRHDHKFNMVDVQNATLAGTLPFVLLALFSHFFHLYFLFESSGGVAMGASADMRLTPFIAIIVGCIAGTVSVFGFSKLQAFLLEVRSQMSQVARIETCLLTFGYTLRKSVCTTRAVC